MGNPETKILDEQKYDIVSAYLTIEKLRGIKNDIVSLLLEYKLKDALELLHLYDAELIERMSDIDLILLSYICEVKNKLIYHAYKRQDNTQQKEVNEELISELETLLYNNVVQLFHELMRLRRKIDIPLTLLL